MDTAISPYKPRPPHQVLTLRANRSYKQAASGAGIARDAISFNLVENNNREWADNASFSIGVSDLDALYAEYRGLPARVGPLEKKAWGRREFHMILPSGVCLQFYAAE